MITFFSDPHLGLERYTHTTPESRNRLKLALYEQALSCTQQARPVICLGDLFDTATNDEATIQQGHDIACRSVVLGGNHDSTNRDNKPSSLELLHSIVGPTEAGGRIALRYQVIRTGPLVVHLVPHCMTQSVFVGLLDDLEVHPRAGEQHILCLHCNYESPFASNEATLNLTREQAARLLERFDRILIGHEHNARSDFGGRLQLLGSCHPTSFHDCQTDKYVWRLTKTGDLIPEVIWNSTVGYMKVAAEHVLSHNLPDLAGCQFMDVQGELPATDLPALARRVSDIWKTTPSLFQLRNGAVAKEVSPQSESTAWSRMTTLPERITLDLDGDESMLALWHHYLQQVQA